MTDSLHGIVAARPKRQVAEAGLFVKTCTVTVFSTTSGVLPIKETMSGPMGGLCSNGRHCPCWGSTWLRSGEACGGGSTVY